LALKAFKFAALREHPMSRLLLGNMYYQGQGISKSYSRAYLWWKLAEDLNINGAKQNINMLKNLMNNDEYLKGKKMYDLCMKNTLYNCTKKIDLF
jgi:TPR repeat protein